jgi:orotidine-5'-phosphate decarboxylase
MCELVIGIDPSLYKQRGSVDLVAWGTDVLTTCANQVVGVKFQAAYFENYGMVGLQAMVDLIQQAKSLNLKVVMDAKRGDIGSTSMAYASAYLSPENSIGPNPFYSDFLTVNPLMGEDCLMPFIDVAVKNKKGLFVLLETSNPGATMILKERVASTDATISHKIAGFIQSVHNEMNLKDGEFGPIGVVIGATNKNVEHWRNILPHSIFLMPGIGAQGGDWAVATSCLNANGNGVWVPISRGITSVPLDVPNEEVFKQAVQSNLNTIVSSR